MKRIAVTAAVVVLVGLLGAVPAQTTGPELGKIFIKALTVEGEFTDIELVDSVKDLKKKRRDFVVVDDEADADYLIQVISRGEVPVSGRPSEKTVVATISFREGMAWKPGIKVSKNDDSWSIAAAQIMGEFEKWVKARSVKFVSDKAERFSPRRLGGEMIEGQTRGWERR